MNAEPPAYIYVMSNPSKQATPTFVNSYKTEKFHYYNALSLAD